MAATPEPVSDPRLERLRLDINRLELNKIRFLIEIIGTDFGTNCEHLSETNWTQIADKMSANHYRTDLCATGNAGQYWNDLFCNLLVRFRQIVRMSTSYETSVNLFPLFEEFRSLSKAPDFVTFCNHKQLLGPKLPVLVLPFKQFMESQYRIDDKTQQLIETINKSTFDSKVDEFVSKCSQQKIKTDNRFKSYELDTKTDDSSEERVKCFSLLIKTLKTLLNNYKNNNKTNDSFNQWKELSDNLVKNGFNERISKFTPNPKDFFYDSIDYYVKNYKSLTKIETNLFESVFQIDLRIFFNERTFFYDRLMRMSRTPRLTSNQKFDSFDSKLKNDFNRHNSETNQSFSKIIPKNSKNNDLKQLTKKTKLLDDKEKDIYKKFISEKNYIFSKKNIQINDKSNESNQSNHKTKTGDNCAIKSVVKTVQHKKTRWDSLGIK